MKKVNRLTDNFQPDHYALQLDVSTRLTRKFKGTVTITGSLKKSGAPIMLHAKDIKIKKALVNSIPAEISSGIDDEITIKPSSRISSKELVIVVEFWGKMTDAMHGIYPCYYKEGGKKKELIATQFESHHAREAFPCIDEPAAKATFDLTLKTENKVEVLGNMPVKEQLESGDLLTTCFETSPKMSPYLLAFVVGDLHSISGNTKDNVVVNIWATKAQSKASMEFALDSAVRSIEFFDKYFGIKYPLPKADHVALPDFSSGAMENWGLITYREAYLLADETTAVSTKQLISSVIGHETSHQWFGNLVTMAWWDDLWLNESFANMMQHVVVDAMFPKWHVWDQFASHETLMALRRDSLPGVQSVKTDVNHPDEISTIFDPAIVYAKGGNLLNMLRHYIGEDVFKRGLREYFKKHAYGNTTGDDLWEALSTESGKDLGEFMNIWLTQPGYPVVSVTRKNGQIEISQKHFVIGADSEEKLWPIPLFANDPKIPQILEGRSLISEQNQGSFLKLNQDSKSYYITHYDRVLVGNLLAHLDELSNIDKLQLLNEASLLSKAFTVEAAELVDLLGAYRHEKLQSVWEVMTLLLTDLKRFAEKDDILEAHLKRFACSIANPLYKELGWKAKKEEDSSTTKLRASVISLMLYGENPDAIKAALELYENARDISSLSGELRAMIMGVAVRFGDNQDKVVKNLMDYHKTTTSADLRSDIVAALTSTRDVKTAKKFLKLMTNGDIIKPQDVDTWYVYLLRNKHTRAEAWQWLKDNWAWIEKTYEGDHHYDSFVLYSASSFSDKEYLDKFEEFFSDKTDQIALKRTIEVGLIEISNRARWINANKKSVKDRLAAL